ncbi:MAG: hypothetical protein KF698_08855 [Anaerolineales bacterium]|nr:hypothetical protein [Anaerolineales bacterium]
MGLLDTNAFSRLRRNHGLEHATIHVISRTHPRISTAGHSDPGGFWLLGDLSTEAVYAAVEEALARLNAGERNLAIHPNCGTNLVTASVTAGLAGAFAFGTARNDRERLERLPLAILMSLGGLLLARPLGARIQQRVTTSGDPGSLHVVEIRRTQRGRFTAHRVSTAD